MKREMKRVLDFLVKGYGQGKAFEAGVFDYGVFYSIVWAVPMGNLPDRHIRVSFFRDGSTPMISYIYEGEEHAVDIRKIIANYIKSEWENYSEEEKKHKKLSNTSMYRAYWGMQESEEFDSFLTLNLLLQSCNNEFMISVLGDDPLANASEQDIKEKWDTSLLY